MSGGWCMKNDKDNLGLVSDSIHRMVHILDKMNLTSEEIAERIGGMHGRVRAQMHITALLSGNQELADNIAAANKIITQKRIDAFKQSVADSTYPEFLANMSWTEKSSLSVDMGLSRYGFSYEKPLTEEEQQYYDIIKSSIDKDIEKEVLSAGFDSVEAWREHNAKESRNRGLSFQLHLAKSHDMSLNGKRCRR